MLFTDIHILFPHLVSILAPGGLIKEKQYTSSNNFHDTQFPFNIWNSVDHLVCTVTLSHGISEGTKGVHRTEQLR